MESELFVFENCEVGEEQIKYYGVTTKNQIFQFPEGSYFGSAELDFDKSTLSFYKGNFEVLVGRYTIVLRVSADLLNQE